VKELGGPRGEGAEEERLLAVEDAGIEMRHGHRGRSVEGLPVDLGLVAGDDRGVFADEPLAADGETAEAARFGDAGFLEEMEAAATGADEDKLGAVVKLAGGEITDAHVPAGGGFFEIDDAVVATGDAAAGLAREPSEEFAGMLPKFTSVPQSILVAAMGTSARPSVSNGAQRPIFSRSVVNSIARKKWCAAMAGVAGFEEGTWSSPWTKLRCLDRVDELRGLIDHAGATA
jgi:hypothetical protein